MSPWWSKSSLKQAKKTAKKKANEGGIFGLIRRKLKILSQSKQISSRRHNEIVSKMGSTSLASSPSTLVVQSQNFDERPHSHPPLLPDNVSDTGQVDPGKRASRNIKSRKGSSPLFVYPVSKSDHAQNGHDQTVVEGNLAMDSVCSYNNCDSDCHFDFRVVSPQTSNYGTGNETSTNSPSNHVSLTTQKRKAKGKQVKACVNNQTMHTSPKRHPLSPHMANLQIPQSGGFSIAPDASMPSTSRSPMRAMRPYADTGFLGPGPSSSPGSGHNSSQLFWQNSRCIPARELSPIPSPSRSPMRVVGPEPALNDFWAMRPYADTGFLEPGPSSSPGSGRNSGQLFWENSRCTPERSPIPSPSKSPMRVVGPEPALNGFWATRPSADTCFLGPGPSSSLGSGRNSSQFFWQNSRCTPECSPIPSPSKSPMRVVGPELALNDFWAMRPFADTGFLGPGPSSSPGSGRNSSQLFWENSRCTPERSPIPSPRMTSPGPSPRIRSGAVSPSANWPGDAINGKQQTHRLPLPPLAVFNTSPYSPSYATRTTPTIPSSPGRGDLLASRGSPWKKGRFIGSGTYGNVYIGFDSERGKMCAMKEVTLLADDERSKESAQQLGQEIALLRRLKHKNIVQYYGCDTVDDKFHIFLEYVSAGSIYKLLQEYGPFGENAIRSYTRQILLGLAYLHSKNTVHRDIKGANLLVDPKGHVKLADFGVAKHLSGSACQLSFKGSAHWMAPEVINNANGYNILVDIWSLGCTIHEMATTKPPWYEYEGAAALYKTFNGKEGPPIPDHLSDDGKDFMMQCLQRVPSRRPSAAQLLQHPFVKNVGHNISRPVPRMNQMTSSPRTVLGSHTRAGAGGGGASPSYRQGGGYNI